MDASENIFNNVKKVHLIGIGGIGMSGIAEYLVRKGFKVSGSDLNPGSSGRKLEILGVKIFKRHDAENLPPDTELVI